MRLPRLLAGWIWLHVGGLPWKAALWAGPQRRRSPRVRLGQAAGYRAYGFLQGKGVSQELRRPDGSRVIIASGSPVVAALGRTGGPEGPVLIGTVALSVDRVLLELTDGRTLEARPRGRGLSFPRHFIFEMVPSDGLLAAAIAQDAAGGILKRIDLRAAGQR